MSVTSNYVISSKSLWNQGKPIVVFYSKRSFTIWFLFFLSIFLSISVFYLIFTMDFAKEIINYSSVFTFWIWQVIIIILGNTLTGFMIWYSGRYILKITIFPGEIIQIKTWQMFGSKIVRYKKGDFTGIKFHKGVTNLAGTPSVNAPWLGIKLINEDNKSLIIDMQGEFPCGFNALQNTFKSN